MARSALLRLVFGFSCLPACVAAAQTAGGSSVQLRPCPTDLRIDDTSVGRCFQSDQAWIFSNDSAWASTAAAALQTGAARFKEAFGTVPALGAVFNVRNGVTVNDSAVRAAGARWTIAWAPGDPSALTHEVGHTWFDQWFATRSTRKAPSGAYGSVAADWVDETAAILAEGNTFAAEQQTRLRELHSSGNIVPLATLFTMKHPIEEGTFELSGNVADALLKALRTSGMTPDSRGIISLAPGNDTAIKAMAAAGITAVATSGGGTMMSMELNMTPKQSTESNAFYAEGRSLLDFFAERTGDLGVFGAIAENEAKGSDMKAWLRDNGARYKLPTTVEELDNEWQQWLSSKLTTEPAP